MSNKTKAIQGAKWTTISTVVNAVLQFLQVAIIARILLPSAFGIVGMSTIVISFLSIFAHFGFANSIIYKQESDRRLLSTIYYFNILMGILMYVIIYLTVPLLVAYYHEPKLAGVLKVSAFYFPIVFFGQIYNILLEKELRFKNIAIVDIACGIFATTVTIILAYRDFQELSLVYGLLAGQMVRTLVLNFLGRKYFSPIWYFNLKEIKEHIIFGVYNIGDSLLGWVNGNIDSIIIGGVLGATALGYYNIAFQIAIYPINRICPIIIQTCYPIMAKMNGNIESLKNAYLKISDLNSFFNIPLIGGLFIMAGNVIPLIYGNHWNDSIPLVRIFVFTAFTSCLSYPTGILAYSRGKPNWLFYQNLANFIIKVPVILFAAKYYGIVGVAIGYLISNIISLGINFVMVQYLVGPYLKPFIANVIKPILFCLGMIGAIVVYRYFLPSTSNVNTIIQIVIGGLVFIGLTIKFKMSLKEILNLKQSL